jgi:glutamate dehydrogenase/leucine dehydrogenase
MLQVNSENDYSVASLPAYEAQVVDVLAESDGIGYFVMDRSILGRSWGGFRIATDLSLPEVKILARSMTMKSVLAGVPIGGAKGGIRPLTKTIDNEMLLGLATRLIGRHIRKQSYFLGTDIGFNQKDANRVYELAGSRRRVFSGGLSPGACCARSILASIEYVRQLRSHVETETVALEGFGAMAVPTAKLLTSKGYRIVAISNIEGTLEDPAKLNVEELAELTANSQNDFLSRYASIHPSATFRPDDSINFTNCDILIPGARVFSINERIALWVKAKLVCPIANSPVTALGEQALAKKGILSIPDVISNSGAAIGSFAQHLGADETQTKRIIVDITNSNMKNIFESVSGRPPKILALDIAAQRIQSLKQSEKVTALRWLSPWVREFGVRSILRGIKEYLSLKTHSKPG